MIDLPAATDVKRARWIKLVRLRGSEAETAFALHERGDRASMLCAYCDQQGAHELTAREMFYRPAKLVERWECVACRKLAESATPREVLGAVTGA